MPRLWTIPGEAIGAMEKAARERFHKQLRTTLTKAFPEKARELRPQGMLAAVERGIMLAIAYGIEAEADIERFLHLHFRAGFDIAAHSPAAGAALNSRSLDGSSKIALMEQAFD